MATRAALPAGSDRLRGAGARARPSTPRAAAGYARGAMQPLLRQLALALDGPLDRAVALVESHARAEPDLERAARLRRLARELPSVYGAARALRPPPTEEERELAVTVTWRLVEAEAGDP